MSRSHAQTCICDVANDVQGSFTTTVPPFNPLALSSYDSRTQSTTECGFSNAPANPHRPLSPPLSGSRGTCTGSRTNRHNGTTMPKSNPSPNLQSSKLSPTSRLTALPLRPPPPPPPRPPPPPLAELSHPPPPPNNDSDIHKPTPIDKYRHISYEQEQDNLRDVRDNLLGERCRLQFHRKKLRDLRNQTGEKEGAAIGQLRRFLLESSLQLPEDMQAALDDAYSLRDQLGILESEYEEAEEKYGSLEWAYTQKETKFIDMLPDNHSILPLSGPRVPGPLIEQEKRGIETEELTSFALGSPEVWIIDGVTSAEDPDTAILSRNDEVHGSASKSSVFSQIDVPNFPGTQDLDQGDICLQSRLGWATKLIHIDAWLLDMLENSSLQRMHLRALSGEDSDDTQWWAQVKEHWKSYSLEVPVFHTGDSTVSHPQELATSMEETPGDESFDLHTSQSNALLSEGPPTDSKENYRKQTEKEPSEFLVSGVQDNVSGYILGSTADETLSLSADSASNSQYLDRHKSFGTFSYQQSGLPKPSFEDMYD